MADYGYIFLYPRRIDQFWYLYALFNVTVLYVFTEGETEDESVAAIAGKRRAMQLLKLVIAA